MRNPNRGSALAEAVADRRARRAEEVVAGEEDRLGLLVVEAAGEEGEVRRLMVEEEGQVRRSAAEEEARECRWRQEEGAPAALSKVVAGVAGQHLSGAKAGAARAWTAQVLLGVALEEPVPGWAAQEEVPCCD